MKQKQMRLVRVAREIGVSYNRLHYNISVGNTPVRKSVGYTQEDLELLRAWVISEGWIEKPESSLVALIEM